MKKLWNHICRGTCLALAAFGLATGVAAAEVAKEPAHNLPPKALIPGVPYVSWSEAAQWRYEQKDIVNPSIVAAHKMIRRYWGQDRRAFFQFGPEEYLPEHWKDVPRDRAGGLGDLKAWLARGVPVYVTLPRTPHAHPNAHAGIGLALLATPATRAQSGPSSKILVTWWWSFPELLQLGEKFVPQRKNAYFWESVTAAARVVIGYDDERRVMIVHDPSFGPAWEMGYEDFENMWRYNEFVFMARPPEGYAEFVAKRPPADPYPPHTPDMRAAVHYVAGYGLSQIGKAAEAERELEQGLAIANVGNGYRFLLAYELAHHRKAGGWPQEAIALLRQAIEALPEAPAPWDLLASIYRENPSLADAQQRAAEAGQRVHALAGSREGMRTVYRTMPRDFHVVAVASYRGWACEPDFRGSRCE